jgi:hypothetical protein
MFDKIKHFLRNTFLPWLEKTERVLEGQTGYRKRQPANTASSEGAAGIQETEGSIPQMPQEEHHHHAMHAGENGLSAAGQAIVASLEPQVLWQQGKESEIMLRLQWEGGGPVLPDALEEHHEAPIHLFAVTESFQDFHHLHPEPVKGQPGLYRFTMSPHRQENYRFYTETLSPDGTMSVALASLPSPVAGQESTLEADASQLAVSSHVMFASEPQVGKRQALTVTLMENGEPLSGLERFKGSFCHVIGLHEDGKTLLHLHPANPEDKEPPFLMNAMFPKEGTYHFYVQFSREGELQTQHHAVQVERQLSQGLRVL